VAHLLITAEDLAGRLEGIDAIGRGEDGWTRMAWTAEDAAAGEWFAEQAASVGLRAERDPAGNRWAVPDAPGPWLALGSHTDTVRCGGRFDGALGVAAAFEVASRADRPVAVISFADEEGARFNTPTFGSRALVGRLDVEGCLRREDDDGVTLAEAMRSAGLEPERLGEVRPWLFRLAGFLELHIDQTRDLARAGAPAGAVRGVAARARIAIEFRGRADHSGTTPRAERSDALLTAARLIVRADELATDPDFRVTATRMLVEPNALTTVPSHVWLWLDARSQSTAALDDWRSRLESECAASSLTTASRSAAAPFDEDLTARLRAALPGAPLLISYAGHDAAILAERIPAAMVFVRNETGVSHCAEEDVTLEDAAAGANALLCVAA
jgi:beta-ureidopropionase / N-carbamoyl-L-amino-acid hydrolase